MNLPASVNALHRTRKQSTVQGEDTTAEVQVGNQETLEEDLQRELTQSLSNKQNR